MTEKKVGSFGVVDLKSQLDMILTIDEDHSVPLLTLSL